MKAHDSIPPSPHHDEATADSDPPVATLSRRSVLQGAGLTPTIALVGGSLGAATALLAPNAHAEVLGPLSKGQRRSEAFGIRKQAAKANRQQWKAIGQQPTNDDESFADRRGSFHKCLPHNALGEVDPAAYDQLRWALDSGLPDDFEAIALDPAAQRRLANPQAALSFTMTGLDPQFGRMPAAPELCGLTTAAEMGELYWAALTREVPFREYSTNPLVGQALVDLNGFSETVGPTVGGQVTAATFQRGLTPGDLVGPFISQLLAKPVGFGLATIEQSYPVPTAVDFMTQFGPWLDIQRGAAPAVSTSFLPGTRYVSSGRGLAEYVHVDALFQAYLFAALITLGFGPGAQNPNNPYIGSATQGGFTTHGGPEVLDVVTKVANLALRAAWFQKWSVHRRLRPEVYGGRLSVQLQGTKHYGLPSEVENSAAVAALLSANGNALLPQAFPEGSPTHPAYPAGHAAVAGACCTVLKAMFNESFVIPNPVEATADGQSLDPWLGTDLTLGGELDKLASNITLGRDLAGVHYRSDGTDGLFLGEQVALAMLADDTRLYNEDFGGFELTSFDGTSVLIVDGEVYTL